MKHLLNLVGISFLLSIAACDSSELKMAREVVVKSQIMDLQRDAALLQKGAAVPTDEQVKKQTESLAQDLSKSLSKDVMKTLITEFESSGYKKLVSRDRDSLKDPNAAAKSAQEIFTPQLANKTVAPNRMRLIEEYDAVTKSSESMIKGFAQSMGMAGDKLADGLAKAAKDADKANAEPPKLDETARAVQELRQELEAPERARYEAQLNNSITNFKDFMANIELPKEMVEALKTQTYIALLNRFYTMTDAELARYTVFMTSPTYTKFLEALGRSQAAR